VERAPMTAVYAGVLHPTTMNLLTNPLTSMPQKVRSFPQMLRHPQEVVLVNSDG